MSLKFILIVLLCLYQVNAASNIFNSSKLINEFGREMDEIIDTAIKNENNDRSIINDIMNIAICKSSGGNKNSDEINKLMNISSHLNYILMHMDHKFGIIKKEMRKSSMQSEIDLVRQGIADDITNIRRHYMMTSRYSDGVESYDRDELESVMKTLTDQTSGKDVQSSLASLFDRTVGQGIGNLTTNFLKLYGEYWERKKIELCGDGLSPNNYLYNLYTLLVSTEMMGLIPLNYGYELQRKFFNSSVQYELREARIAREHRLTQYFISFKKIIKSASLSFRSCDPPENIRDQTFFEMVHLYQDILVQEIGNQILGSCFGDCPAIDLKSYDTCSRVHECWTIPSPTWCEPAVPWRRYQWIGDNTGFIYGNKSECTGGQRHFDAYFYISGRCDMCWCTCEGYSLEAMETRNSVHVFSLLPSQSDIMNNMVVTGVRFVVEHQVVHIRVKEGQLGDEGQIVKDSESWKDNENMRQRIIEARKGDNNFYVSEKDFVVIDEHHNAINLDDIIVPPGHVVTGIRFGLTQERGMKSPWQRLEIQVQYMPFDSTSGILDHSSKAQWMSSTVLHTEVLDVVRRRSPEKSTTQNVPSKALNHFIKFGPSIWKEDAGQTTLPFLDSIPVETISGALSGIGLFHKGSESYGGFLSFRLYTLNFTQYMMDNRLGHYEYSIDDSDQAEDD